MSTSTSSINTLECESPSEDDMEYTDERTDEQCLKPIRSMPGCSRLCDACLWIFQHTPMQICERPPVDRSHVRYLATLEKSAGQGCLLCSRLFSNVGRFVSDHDPMTTINMRFYRDAEPDDNPFGTLWFYDKHGSAMGFTFVSPARELLYNPARFGLFLTFFKSWFYLVSYRIFEAFNMHGFSVQPTLGEILAPALQDTS